MNVTIVKTDIIKYAGFFNVCFSFIKLTGDEWLLVSAGEIIEVPKGTWAKVDVIKERFAPLFGRLVIKRKKKNSFGAYTFNIDTYLEEDSVVVKEILPCIYSGEQFEGYDKVHLPYRRLADIFDGKIMPTYYEALKKITGVYCLTDTSNGKLYIGSATGSEGVAQIIIITHMCSESLVKKTLNKCF